MKTGLRVIAVAALLTTALLTAPAARADELYARAGWSAVFPLGSHQVQGRATIIDERTIHVENFTYDGGGPAVYFYLGATNTSSAFSSGLQLMPLLTGTVFADESITVTLPPGQTLDGYQAISVWCAAVGVSFSSGTFQPPASTYARRGWVAELDGIFHQVAGTATIIDERLVHVENFTYDGTAPLVYFYFGGNDTFDAFLNGLGVEPELDRAYVNEDVVLAMPDGETLDAYSALSVWCAEFDVNFGSGVFKPVLAADVDNDGDVDNDDFAGFADCLSGPGGVPAPSGMAVQACLDAFDADEDGDVDLADYVDFHQAFTGPPPETATYELIFDATWSAATHPTDFPPNPHFSPLIGGTHNDQVVFWDVGAPASPGIESMAETGGTATLAAEVNAAIVAGHAESIVGGGAINPSPGSVTTTFVVSQAYSLVTVTSMIAPSPDWFVGIADVGLFHDNQWTPQLVIPLPPYDAGTDSGATYTSPNADTIPQENIKLIQGPPFQYGFFEVPLGTFTLRRAN